MTTNEMRRFASNAGNQIFTENAQVGMTNKIVAVLWSCCAEICDRLDFIANCVRNNDNRIG